MNGDLELDRQHLVVNGTQGNVHANGDINGSGNRHGITGNITATGDIADDIDPGGLKAGGMPADSRSRNQGVRTTSAWPLTN